MTDTSTVPPAPPPPRREPPRWLTNGIVPAVVGAVAAFGVSALVQGGSHETVRTVTEAAPVAATPVAASSEVGGDDSTPVGPRLTAGRIYEQVKMSVVRVESREPGSPSSALDPGASGRMGTGFVIDRKGHVVTNAHVIVAGSKKAVVMLSDGSEHTASVLGRDEDTDVAVLKAEGLPQESTPVPLGSVLNLRVGDPLVAIGNPLGFDLSVTTGIVSALKRPIRSPNMCAVQNVVQTDAAINQGNSGGPLFDERGRVIGINSQIATDNGGNVGIGLAVPIDITRPVVQSIIATGTAQHPRMGIQGKEMTAAIQKANNMPGQKGVMVVVAQDDGPAKKAGLRGATSGTGDRDTPKGGDIIVSVDDRPMYDMPDVNLAVSSKPVGSTIRVSVLRDGKTLEIPVTLVDRQGPCPR